MKKLIFRCAILAGLAGLAFGATITVTDSSGSFSNPVPVAGITITNGDPHSEIRWGQPASNAGQSGYNFDATIPPVVTKNLVPGGTTDWFLLAGFQHVNQPIYAPSLEHVDLDVSLTFDIDGGAAITKTFGYLLNHEETTNAVPCAYPSVSPCADRVTVSAPASGIFTVGNVVYTLVLQFSTDGGQTTESEFITQENQTNDAGIYARFSSRVEDVPEIPEPTTFLLMGAGLTGLALLRRR